MTMPNELQSCGWKQSFRYYPSVFLEGLRKTMNHVRQINWCPGQDSNQTVPEQKSEALLVKPISSANSCLTGTRNFSYFCMTCPLQAALRGLFFTHNVFATGSAWDKTWNEGMETSTLKALKTLKWSKDCNISAVYVEKWKSEAGQIKTTLSESVVVVSIFFKEEKFWNNL